MAQPVKMLAAQGCWQLDFDPQTHSERKETSTGSSLLVATCVLWHA